MHTGLEEMGSGVLGTGKLDKMAAYFAERYPIFLENSFICCGSAKGGVGIIVTGGVAPNKAG